MCYPLPGPRCANHLANDISTVTLELETYDRIIQSRPTPENQQMWQQKYNRLTDLQEQYDGTKTGQEKLDKEIVAAPNKKTQDYLVNRKLIAKAAYDRKKAAYKAVQDSKVNDKTNKVLYLQGRDEELAQRLLANEPVDPKSTPASLRQSAVNALLNYKAQFEPVKTVKSQIRGAATVRDNVVPKGYFVISGQPAVGSGNSHYVFKGTGPDDKNAQLVGHAKVRLKPDFTVAVSAYRGNEIIGGETVEAQTSHLDTFNAIINPDFKSDTARDRFDFDDIRRIDWATEDNHRVPARRRNVA